MKGKEYAIRCTKTEGKRKGQSGYMVGACNPEVLLFRSRADAEELAQKATAVMSELGWIYEVVEIGAETMTQAQYYKLLEEKYNQTDWNSLASIKAYNEYARQLRKMLAED